MFVQKLGQMPAGSARPAGTGTGLLEHALKRFDPLGRCGHRLADQQHVSIGRVVDDNSGLTISLAEKITPPTILSLETAARNRPPDQNARSGGGG